MSYIGRNVLDAVGNTPLIELQRVLPDSGCRILVKVEMFSPGGSVKIRPAQAMIRAAEEQGLLHEDSIIVEASSGNQGIAISLVGAVLGYRVRIVMPSNMSEERKCLMRAYGAELVLTEAGADIGEAICTAMDTAKQMAAEDPRVFFANQFCNTANCDGHRTTTAREIVEQLGDEGPISAFVTGVGTGGTLTGVGGVLKSAYPGCRVVAVEPENAAILSGMPISHHLQQGIGDGMIPDILDTDLIDQMVIVSDTDAIATARRLAKEEGLFAGISSGSNVWAALELGRTMGPESIIVTLCPDTGERYLSLGLCADALEV